MAVWCCMHDMSAPEFFINGYYPNFTKEINWCMNSVKWPSWYKSATLNELELSYKMSFIYYMSLIVWLIDRSIDWLQQSLFWLSFIYKTYYHFYYSIYILILFFFFFSLYINFHQFWNWKAQVWSDPRLGGALIELDRAFWYGHFCGFLKNPMYSQDSFIMQRKSIAPPGSSQISSGDNIDNMAAIGVRKYFLTTEKRNKFIW